MAKRAINAKHAVADIRSGMDDDALIAKYHLSAEGLQSLFDKLVTGGFIDLSEIARRLPGFLGVVAISESASSGQMGEVTASPRPLKTKSPPLINVQEAARDIRWGIGIPLLWRSIAFLPMNSAACLISYFPQV